MTALIVGLVVFLGAHSVRIFADGWRGRQLARLGERPWKALYSLVSLSGFALLVWGYSVARTEPVWLWAPPGWTRHLTALLMLPAFILLGAAYVPGTRLKAAVGHPMVLSVKVWAFAHLLSNGTLADVTLFGPFLAWAVLDYAAAQRRDRAAGVVYRTGPVTRDVLATVIGAAAWAVFAIWLHAWLIGVRPFG